MRTARHARKSTLLAHQWSRQNFRFGKAAAAPEFSTAPHCGPVDTDFDRTDSLTLERQDGRLQRVRLSEVA